MAKTKLTKYTVTIKRVVENIAVVEVEATSEADAKQKAEAEADQFRSGCWREGDIVSEDVKVKAGHA